MSNPSPSNINKFQAYNILFNKCKRNAKKQYYFNQFEVKKENIKQTWTLIRDVIGSQSKKREDLPSFVKQNQDILNNPNDIADGFNDFLLGSDLSLQQRSGQQKGLTRHILRTVVQFLISLQFRKMIF